MLMKPFFISRNAVLSFKCFSVTKAKASVGFPQGVRFLAGDLLHVRDQVWFEVIEDLCSQRDWPGGGLGIGTVVLEEVKWNVSEGFARTDTAYLRCSLCCRLLIKLMDCSLSQDK